MLGFTADVTIPENFYVKAGATRNIVNVFHHSQYIGYIEDLGEMLFGFLRLTGNEYDADYQNVSQHIDWQSTINDVIEAYQLANPVIVDRLPSGVIFEARTVYFVPELNKFPLKVIAHCEDEQDAEDIATFFRNRDKIYAYAWTDANNKPTLLSNLK